MAECSCATCRSEHDEEVQGLRENLAVAMAEAAELRESLLEAEFKSRVMHNAAVKTAETTEVALDRLIYYRAIVIAAEKFIDDPTSVNAMMALSDAVADYKTRKPS